ncbi:MAG: hypothetical protein LKG27_05210 [Clostridiaceae bacterium]|jgi:hypothetical protein|nr:hypothetical protein [Clostridiaceae bacterium]
MKSAKFNTLSIVLFFVLTCFFTKTYAQQTIINVPSSDVLPAENMIIKTSVKTQLGDDKYTRITPTAIMGLGHGMDLSVGVPTKINEDFNTQASADVGLKKVWFAGPSTRITAGGSVAPSFNDSVTPSMFAYAHVSQKIRKSRTSLTFGGYMHGRNHFLNKGGVVVGVDQVIIPNKLRLALDWMSGETDKGNFAVGLKYRPVPTLSITSAVIIPNRNSDNIAFQISVSKYFSFDFDSNDKNTSKKERL